MFFCKGSNLTSALFGPLSSSKPRESGSVIGADRNGLGPLECHDADLKIWHGPSEVTDHRSRAKKRGKQGD